MGGGSRYPPHRACAVMARHGWYCIMGHMCMCVCMYLVGRMSYHVRWGCRSPHFSFSRRRLLPADSFFFLFQHATSHQQASRLVWSSGTLSVCVEGTLLASQGQKENERTSERVYRVHDGECGEGRVQGPILRAHGGMLACWGHVLSMPMLMPACTGGQTCRGAEVRAVQRTNDCLDATRWWPWRAQKGLKSSRARSVAGN